MVDDRSNHNVKITLPMLCFTIDDDGLELMKSISFIQFLLSVLRFGLAMALEIDLNLHTFVYG